MMPPQSRSLLSLSPPSSPQRYLLQPSYFLSSIWDTLSVCGPLPWGTCSTSLGGDADLRPDVAPWTEPERMRGAVWPRTSSSTARAILPATPATSGTASAALSIIYWEGIRGEGMVGWRDVCDIIYHIKADHRLHLTPNHIITNIAVRDVTSCRIMSYYTMSY
jgi:hypothetical protein